MRALRLTSVDSDPVFLTVPRLGTEKRRDRLISGYFMFSFSSLVGPPDPELAECAF